MKYAYDNNFVPFVDMKNFPTKYNQRKNTNNIKNVWELYFNQISNYKIDEVYKSKNVYFSKTKINTGLRDYKNKYLKKIFKKNKNKKKRFKRGK